jgi:hypothetical protein
MSSSVNMFSRVHSYGHGWLLKAAISCLMKLIYCVCHLGMQLCGKLLIVIPYLIVAFLEQL